jgi:phosphohistidine swiveling domain-containing protein
VSDAHRPTKNPVRDLADAKETEAFGGKAVNLGTMLRAGLPVLSGFVAGLDAFDKNGQLKSAARQEISRRLIDKKYAVRSSATVEDASNASWAGQFETFLNVELKDIMRRMEQCHNFAAKRTESYAHQKTSTTDFRVAVVVQEMLAPEYAGVLFTKDPVSGTDKFVTEYVEGLGENLVSGKITPKRIEWPAGQTPTAPFNIQSLTNLTKEVVAVFGAPQDIEWAYADGKMWLVQARPITTVVEKEKGLDLGEPEDLFYWGPSRATVLHMGDFMAGVERFFAQCTKSQALPNPPKTLVLFHNGKMVWLNNASDFSDFTKNIFDEYVKQNRVQQDLKTWRKLTEKLPRLTDDEFNEKLIETWQITEFAEFALYGAEKAIGEKLARFDERTRAKIWSIFSAPDKLNFLNLLDKELATSRDTKVMAKKYPWIRDGYAGSNAEAEWYFQERLTAIDRNGLAELHNHSQKRKRATQEYKLGAEEVDMLNLARTLAEFMDERKEWMMKTRRLIERPVSEIKHGWLFDDGKIVLVNKTDTEAIWERYINFRAASSAVKGVVANTNGRHFVSGEVAVLNAHTDPVADDKVLVVPSTSPGWVPLMHRARALITDHGGMMSHAAIVAREFGLPCIVGTGNGTKVLTTGDKVVLDLITGEVLSH